MVNSKNISAMWENSSRMFGEKTAYGVRHSRAEKTREGKITEVAYFQTHPFKDVEQRIVSLGAGLAAIGLEEKDGVGIIAENCLEWAICDFAVIGNRAYNVPRGISSTDKELQYILEHAEVKLLIVQDEEQLKRAIGLKQHLPNIKKLIVFTDSYSSPHSEGEIYSLEQIYQLGKNPEFIRIFKERREKIQSDDIFTIMYTSGTTGTPKGIPLTHSNVMHNVLYLPLLLHVDSSDRLLSPLPIWHVFERTIEYAAIASGCSVWYTDKLTLVKDLLLVEPTFLASVPRVWLSVFNAIKANIRNQGKEKLFTKFYSHSLKVLLSRRYNQSRQFLSVGESAKKESAGVLDHLYHRLANFLIYRKIRKKLGRYLRAGISGGGSLPVYIDDFFEIVGITILDGYGLTETSPVLSVRTFEHHIPYTAGRALPETDILIEDEEGHEILDSQKGTLWVHGPQVMGGYYKNPEETTKVMKIDEQNRRWFNTGDLAKRTKKGDISILGRTKSTIVLLGGENIEPEPIEDKLLVLPGIDQVMVCGQNQEYLTALVVPNRLAIKEECEKLGLDFPGRELSLLTESQEFKTHFLQLIRNAHAAEEKVKEIEIIHDFVFTKPFVYEDQTLTQTFKLKRYNIEKRDESMIRKMYPHYYEIGEIKNVG